MVARNTVESTLHSHTSELLESRKRVPDLVQFYGMEFDTPGADHSSLIIPFSDREAHQLFAIESRFAKREPWPADPTWDAEPRMLEALRFMRGQDLPPLVIANHPSRSAPGLRQYRLGYANGITTGWNDTAPTVAVGMAGAPGHQAASLNPDGTIDPSGPRGGYRNYPTVGGFDQFTATLGGFWDSMLSEGRRWWITANSDSHVHYTEGGNDFWPGEYSKNLCLGGPLLTRQCLTGCVTGVFFVTTGDLISELYLTVKNSAGVEANIGGSLNAAERGIDRGGHTFSRSWTYSILMVTTQW